MDALGYLRVRLLLPLAGDASASLPLGHEIDTAAAFVSEVLSRPRSWNGGLGTLLQFLLISPEEDDARSRHATCG
jgi:hypothetical protein